MATHMAQFRYSTASVKGMVARPHDRKAAAARIFEAAGGKLEAMYFCFGEFDGIALIDFPSNIDAASSILAVASSGALETLRTTVLIDTDDAIDAMKKAHDIVGSYTPPAG